MPYYLLIASVLVFLIALKLAKFFGLIVLALIVIMITLKKNSKK